VRETVPKVRLIAEPRVHWPAVREHLEDVDGLEWYDRIAHAGAPDAEVLVEYAGRRCYRSWAPGLNANVTKVREDSASYLENILKSGHGAVLEHASFTFDFDQVSRVFTHELIRHRTGVAISQESLRYVRLTDLGVRIPPILEDGPAVKRIGPCNFTDAEELGAEATADYCYVHQDFCNADRTRPMREAVVSLVEHLEEFQRNAAEAFGLDDEDVPFHYKKEVTSALRRLAPIGLSTGMVWTANARTLRHDISLRTAPAAEEEIRLVFAQVARLMIDRYPALFSDFEERPVPDSDVAHWEPRWEKV
jgi:thymidylate synthase (FAD)